MMPISTVKPGLQIAEVGRRYRVTVDGNSVEGLAQATGFDPSRGNWIVVKLDDGSEIECREITRHAMTIDELGADSAP